MYNLFRLLLVWCYTKIILVFYCLQYYRHVIYIINCYIIIIKFFAWQSRVGPMPDIPFFTWEWVVRSLLLTVNELTCNTYIRVSTLPYYVPLSLPFMFSLNLMRSLSWTLCPSAGNEPAPGALEVLAVSPWLSRRCSLQYIIDNVFSLTFCFKTDVYVHNLICI